MNKYSLNKLHSKWFVVGLGLIIGSSAFSATSAGQRQTPQLEATSIKDKAQEIFDTNIAEQIINICNQLDEKGMVSSWDILPICDIIKSLDPALGLEVLRLVLIDFAEKLNSHSRLVGVLQASQYIALSGVAQKPSGFSLSAFSGIITRFIKERPDQLIGVLKEVTKIQYGNYLVFEILAPNQYREGDGHLPDTSSPLGIVFQIIDKMITNGTFASSSFWTDIKSCIPPEYLKANILDTYRFPGRVAVPGYWISRNFESLGLPRTGTFIKAFPFVLNIELSIFEVLQIVNDNFENLRYEGELEPSDAPIQPPTVRPYHEASRADEENPERGRRASGRGGGRRGAVRGERS